MADDEALEFFNRLTGRLELELSEPPVQIAPALLNMRAPESARLVKVALELEYFEEGADDPRPLTEEEWALVVLRTPTLVLRGEAEEPVEHRALNGEHFTVRELVDAIIATERATRGMSEWFGGIDVHHVYFEGIDEEDDGSWTISWGS